MNESYEMTFTLKDADMKKLFEIFEDININNCPYFEIQDKYGNSAKYYRENPPSAQPEIIRCRDCKHWDKTWTNNWSPDYHYCPMIEGVRKGNFYCADAERREE